MKQKPYLFVSAIIALFIWVGIVSCGGSNETDKVEVYLPDYDPQVILPPGPIVVDGSTLVIQGHNQAPIVHSYPEYAGVENPGEVGIGSSAGYDPQDSFVVPININLGNKVLGNYKFLLKIDHPDLININWIDGNNPRLATDYPDQYQAIESGFNQPTREDGSTNYPQKWIYISDSGSATGRVNLVEISFTILDTLPSQGINLDFEIIELKDDQGNDLCPQFQGGCTVWDGVIINNFRIEQP